MNAIVIIISFFGTFIGSIIMHEVGHIIYFRDQLDREIHIRVCQSKLEIFGYKTNIPFYSIKTGIAKDYDEITIKQHYYLCLSGIAWGFIPIIVMGLFYSYLILWIIPAYLYGCKKDINIMYRLMKYETY
jgi:hypothetical protein